MIGGCRIGLCLLGLIHPMFGCGDDEDGEGCRNPKAVRWSKNRDLHLDAGIGDAYGSGQDGPGCGITGAIAYADDP